MNGVRLDALKCIEPTTTTSSTTPTLMTVITAEKFDDSLVPSTRRVDTIPMMSRAPQSNVKAPSVNVPPAKPKTVPR